MAYDPELAPARWVRREAARRERVVWIVGGVFFLVGGVQLALALGHGVGIGLPAALIALVVALKPQAERVADDAANWMRGARAEEAVGETLNELRRSGWVLMHDVEQDGEGNIDHLAWSPTGVYLVETKTRRYEDRDLTKVKRQAAKVHDRLGGWVTPVICLHRRTGRPFRAQGVWVVPHERLLDWLPAQRNQPIPFERFARFAERIDAA